MATNTDEKVEEPVDQQAEEIPETPEDATSEASTEETPSEESVEVEAEAEAVSETEPELTEDERKNLSEKAQKRYSKLANKAAETDRLREEVRTLKEAQGTEFTAGVNPVPVAGSQPQALPKLPWEEALERGEDPTLTPEDYKRDVLANADVIVEQRIKESEARRDKVSEVKDDLLETHKKYDRLNPNSETFDKELSTKLATLYNNQLKADPSARLLDFVDTVMDVRESGKEEGKVEATSQLSEQEAEEALTPSETGGEEAPVNFEELPLAEQEKYLKDHGLWES
jgi:hypothetical protein